MILGIPLHKTPYRTKEDFEWVFSESTDYLPYGLRKIKTNGSSLIYKNEDSKIVFKIPKNTLLVIDKIHNNLIKVSLKHKLFKNISPYKTTPKLTLRFDAGYKIEKFYLERLFGINLEEVKD